eukprot:1154581-Pelagomonas_calceolata.AAC.1
MPQMLPRPEQASNFRSQPVLQAVRLQQGSRNRMCHTRSAMQVSTFETKAVLQAVRQQQGPWSRMCHAKCAMQVSTFETKAVLQTVRLLQGSRSRCPYLEARSCQAWARHTLKKSHSHKG